MASAIGKAAARRVRRKERGLESGVRQKVMLSVGELVAAAFDALGQDAERVARVLASRPMASAVGRRIVLC
ncbi:MAG: chaperonin [Myxococcales bacterium]|nr:chaperonin [Myxococcales bacterium]